MRIKSLKINNLRNISSAGITPHPRLNVFHGDNGAGKTSILEALVVLGKGRSFRNGQVSSLVGPQADSFLVSVETEGDRGNHRLGLERSRQDWSARIDGRDASAVSELSAYLPFSLLEPNSHALVSGAPDGRRRFLDWGVFHVKHEYLDHWRRYTLAVRQRNAALRSAQPAVARSLDPQLIRHGEYLDAARGELVQSLSLELQALGPAFQPGALPVEIEYTRGWKGDNLSESLEASWQGDLERGATRTGPHRAELELRVGGQVARERLSRGEQKLLAASLLLAQARILARTQAPLLLLDDLASEFDADRMRGVLEAGLALGAQVWVTGVSARPCLELATGNLAVFHVEHGRVSGPT